MKVFLELLGDATLNQLSLLFERLNVSDPLVFLAIGGTEPFICQQWRGHTVYKLYLTTVVDAPVTPATMAQYWKALRSHIMLAAVHRIAALAAMGKQQQEK